MTTNHKQKLYLAIECLAFTIAGFCLANIVMPLYTPVPTCEGKPVTTTYRLNGDVDRSGAVNEADTMIVKNNMGLKPAKWADGDLNDDGQVDELDLSIVLQNQGNGKPGFRLI